MVDVGARYVSECRGEETKLVQEHDRLSRLSHNLVMVSPLTTCTSEFEPTWNIAKRHTSPCKSGTIDPIISDSHANETGGISNERVIAGAIQTLSDSGRGRHRQP
jgi:hypothetical protein